jgi:hypothetical protein
VNALLDLLKLEARQKDIGLGRLRELAMTNVQLARYIAGLKRTPSLILDELAQHDDAITRAAVPRHPATPRSTLEFLARDSASAVLKAVAGNPNVTAAICELLIHHPQASVRIAAAWKTKAVQSLKFLAGDSDARVREIAARKPKLPLLAVEMLCNDPNPNVKSALAGTRAETSVLSRLALEKDCIVRINVAGNRNATSEILEQLAQDPDEQVRTRVAQNRAVPLHVIEVLAQDIHEHVCLVATHRKNYLARA